MPGSRILLLGYCDGSVRYFDLDECERSPTYTPKFLLPPTFSDDPVSVCMHTAYDFSLEGAQSSSPHTRCIDHFNLGTVTNALIQGWRTLVQVWRIDVVRSELDSRITGLKVAECLSSYRDEIIYMPVAVSLYGDTIAYAVDHAARRCAVINVVKWAEENGKEGEHEVNRRVIRNMTYSVRV